VGPACLPSSFLQFEVYAVDNSHADKEADPSFKDSERVVRMERREGWIASKPIMHILPSPH